MGARPPAPSSAAPMACNFIKKEALVHVLSCKLCEISKSTLFYRTPPGTASVYYSQCDKLIISYLKDFGTINKTLFLKLIFNKLSSVKINGKYFLNTVVTLFSPHDFLKFSIVLHSAKS